MLAFKSILKIDKSSGQSVYLQLAVGIIQLINTGILRPGAKLPSIRQLSKELGIHPKTVTAAYEEIAAQNWVYSKPRSGIFVAENLPELKPRSFRASKQHTQVAQTKNNTQENIQYKYSINDGFPDYRIAPVKQLFKYYKTALFHKEVERHAMFFDQSGSIRLRIALAGYIAGSRAMNIHPENILLTRGAQMAMFIAASLLVKPGDEVLVGDPGYRTANETFERLGAKLIRIPVDENGIDVDMIEKLSAEKPRLLYIIPHHHHPTTVTLSSERRRKLLSLISKYKFHVIEDDYDYEFHYTHKPILPLASADTEGLIWYMGSITKNLMPSMRMGYLIAPATIISEAARLKRLLDIRGDNLLEDAIAEMYINGTMQRHIRRSVKLYEQRRNLFCELLKEQLAHHVQFAIPEGGLSVWVQFHKSINLPQVARKAASQGLGMSDGLFYNTGNKELNALRMGFASLDEKEMKEVVEILKRIVEAHC